MEQRKPRALRPMTLAGTRKALSGTTLEAPPMRPLKALSRETLTTRQTRRAWMAQIRRAWTTAPQEGRKWYVGVCTFLCFVWKGSCGSFAYRSFTCVCFGSDPYNRVVVSQSWHSGYILAPVWCVIWLRTVSFFGYKLQARALIFVCSRVVPPDMFWLSYCKLFHLFWVKIDTSNRMVNVKYCKRLSSFLVCVQYKA